MSLPKPGGVQPTARANFNIVFMQMAFLEASALSQTDPVAWSNLH